MRIHTEDGYLWLSEDLTHAGGRGGCAGGETGTCERQNLTVLVNDMCTWPAWPAPVRLQLPVWGKDKPLEPPGPPWLT